MELNLNNSTDSGRVELTADQTEKLFSAMQKLAREKRDLIVASHPPEYWENYWEAVKLRRARIRQERLRENLS